MKKVIVTTDNYEEVMFDLLEDQYPREVREDVLDQIHADTFLSFEWTQWSKSSYSASTEPYKVREAEFIEGLTKEEKKKGFVYYLAPIGIAASIALLAGVYFHMGKSPVAEPAMTSVPTPAIEVPAKLGTSPVARENAIVTAMPGKKRENRTIGTLPVVVAAVDSPVMTVAPIVKQASFTDTIQTMIAEAQKQPRYKVTIIEEQIEAGDNEQYKYKEKRYSMADVMRHKDGITLSKFLDNPKSRIVTDKSTNKVTIEYIAEDYSILVLTLSQ